MTNNIKEDKKMKTKNFKFETETGKSVEVTVSLITEKVLNADGDKITVPCCDVEVKTEIRDIDFISFSRPYKRSGLPDGYVAIIDNLILTQDQLVGIENIISEIECFLNLYKYSGSNKIHINVVNHVKHC